MRFYFSTFLFFPILGKWNTAASPGVPRCFLSAAPENRAAIQDALELPQPPTGRCSVGVGLHHSLYLREARMCVTSPSAVTTSRARVLTYAKCPIRWFLFCFLFFICLRFTTKYRFGEGEATILARTHILPQVKRKVCETSDTV